MPECDVSRVTEHLQSFVPDAELESNMSAELSYILPHESKAEFQALFTSLDKRKDELKIAGYGASVTTMEEVFLRSVLSDDVKLMNLSFELVLDIGRSKRLKHFI